LVAALPSLEQLSNLQYLGALPKDSKATVKYGEDMGLNVNISGVSIGEVGINSNRLKVQFNEAT
jgi:hypothetical protein